MYKNGIGKLVRNKLITVMCMKKQWYTKPVMITDDVFVQIEPQDQVVHIYKDNELLEMFALNRKIYTFFKRIQEIVQSTDYLSIENGLGDIYSGDIHLDEPIMMHITNIHHGYLTLDFYRKHDDRRELVFLMPLTYTTATLFKNMLIPYHLIKDPSYRIRHVFKFLDMMHILNLNEVQERG